jgi:hypothetical protein
MSGFGICDLASAPLRLNPDDRSEMASQVLFGETFEILEHKKNWLRIQTNADSYAGWIDEKQCQTIPPKVFLALKEEASTCSLSYLSEVKSEFRIVCISFGSSLPFYDGRCFRMNDEIFELNSETNHDINRNDLYSAIPYYAELFLETPYLWGGRSVAGVDCSGFIQVVFKAAGISLRRDAWQQSEQGNLIHFVNESKPGDVAFFENEEGKISHAGIVLDNHRIIHAHGKVRVDLLDHYGIYNEERKKYSHKLRLIKRMIK